MGNSGITNELYRNDGGGGVFSGVSNSITAISSAFTQDVAWGDMDGDGDLVRRWRSPNALLCVRVREVRPAHAILAACNVLTGSGGGQLRQPQRAASE